MLAAAACSDDGTLPTGVALDPESPDLALVETTTSDGYMVASTDVPDQVAFGATASGTLGMSSLLSGSGGLYTQFIMDSSGSLGSSGWELEKTFVSDLITDMAAGPGSINFGVLSFSNIVKVDWNFTDYQDPATIAATVEYLPFLASYTYTRTAMEAGLDMFTTQAVNPWGRLMLVITDGVPQPTTQHPCGSGVKFGSIKPNLDAAGIRVVIVGVGTNWDPQSLACIVDDPDRDIIEVSDFNELQNIRESISTYVSPELQNATFTATLAPGFELVSPPAGYDAGTRTLTWTPGVIDGSGDSLGFQFEATNPSVCGTGATLLSNVSVAYEDPETGVSKTESVPDVTTDVIDCPQPRTIGIPDGSLVEGGTWTATATVSSPESGLSAVVDWGDGSATETLAVDPSGTIALSHLYADNGSFAVSVEVEDGWESGTGSATVEVSNADPVVTITAFDLDTGDLTGAFDFSDAGAADVLTATIDYGDGTVETVDLASGSGSGDFAHTYTTGGDYTVAVIVTDEDGGSGTASQDVSVVLDRDGDGVPDDQDAFPDDPNEWADTDGDGVGDNADAFPNDPTETVDSDGDGVGDNADAFPNDPTESADTDGDGTGDNADAFPTDPTETTDTDGDGTGDNSDAFPTDPGETADTDGDGVGDNSDPYPSSDISPWVVAGGTTTSVPNLTLPDGSTFNDRIAEAVATAKNDGDAQSAIAHLTNEWQKAGLISGQQKGEIVSAAASKKGDKAEKQKQEKDKKEKKGKK